MLNWNFKSEAQQSLPRKLQKKTIRFIESSVGH